MDVHQRNNWAKSNKLCTNCLKENHKSSDCKNKFTCFTCKKHHTLLHIDDFKIKDYKSTSSSEKTKMSSHQATVENLQALTVHKNGNVLLATAIINVQNTHGINVILRALIDHGSQSAFITENAAQLLGLPHMKISATISGIGAQTKIASKSVQLRITPRYSSNFKLTVNAIILEKLTNVIQYNINNHVKYDHLQQLILADPTFNEEGPIDLLLGAAEFAKIIKSGLIKTEEDSPIAQNTELGWIISGAATKNNPQKEIQITSMVSTSEIDQQIKKFWELNEIAEQKT